MNFYQILLAQKVNGVNRNLTWYDNLFARFYNSAFVKLIAKFLKIKGNTLVWNQLIKNGNFADTSEWLTYNCTLSVSNNIATITDTSGGMGNIYTPQATASKVIAGHKYYCVAEIKADGIYNNAIRFRVGSSPQVFRSETNWVKRSVILEATITNRDYIQFEVYAFNNGSTQCRNCMCYDLTAMGIDNLTTTAEVEAWLLSHIGNLPYYDYIQGTLLSFNGTGIKTTDKHGTELGTLSLPISTYFPDGMKSAGSVYDELTENKATKRLNQIEITSSNIVSDYLDTTTNQYLAHIELTGAKPASTIDELGNIRSNTLEAKTQNVLFNTSGNAVCMMVNGNARITIVGCTTFAQMQTWLDNNPTSFIYELATPTETTIDPPLDLSYSIEWGGTEQLLPENTSVPVTSPILADMHYPDGDRTDQEFTYREIEKTLNRNNRALSIMLGRNVWTDEPQEPLTILLKGE